MTKNDRVAKDLSDFLGFNVWIVRRGRFYLIQRIDNGEFLEYYRFRNLDMISEYINSLRW